jgi:hypothetical protein
MTQYMTPHTRSKCALVISNLISPALVISYFIHYLLGNSSGGNLPSNSVFAFKVLHGVLFLYFLKSFFLEIHVYKKLDRKKLYIPSMFFTF